MGRGDFDRRVDRSVVMAGYFWIDVADEDDFYLLWETLSRITGTADLLSCSDY